MSYPTEDIFFIRPASNQRIPVGRRILANPLEKLYPDVPRIGLVISTFGAVPYVHLALAVRQRLYPDLPVLVHDDASDQTQALAARCQAPGVTFQTNSSRFGHELGDLSSIVGGLHWAKELGLDLLVKMSRRFVPAVNWVPRLQHLAQTTQFATFGRDCQTHGFPLRTECLAMGVEPWSAEEICGPLTQFVLTNHEPVSVERYAFGLAEKVYASNCAEARRWEQKNVRGSPRPPLVMWDMMGISRRQPMSTHLWHETAPPEHYADVGR